MSDIYLVDDHVIVRDGLRLGLEQAGHRVIGESGYASNAIEALLRLQPQVLLLDLGLSPHSGFEVLEQLRQRETSIRTIVLTMSLHAGDVAQALRLGAQGYVLKPSPAQALLLAIDEVLQGRQHLGPGIAELAIEGLALPAEAALSALSGREREVLRRVVCERTSA